MEAGSEFLLVGLSHRTAHLAAREQCAVPSEGVGARLAMLVQIPGVEEAWVISTCNRTEVLVCAPDGQTDGQTDELIRAISANLFPGAESDSLYAYRGLQAVIHLFRVAAGLDSQVLGESQVLAQVKLALEDGRHAGTVGKSLEPLLQHALGVGKRVRAETSVGEGTLSVARAGVRIASRVFGRFDATRVLIVGAGETGLLAAKHIMDGGTPEITLVNRTVERGKKAAKELGCAYAPIDALADEAELANLIVLCVEDAPGLLSASAVGSAQRDRPRVVIDLSVPRAAEPEVGKLHGVLLYDLDDLGLMIEMTREERQRASEEAAAILVAEVHKFCSLRTFAAFSPAIEGLRRRFEEIREDVLDAREENSPAAEREKVAHELTKRLLDAALDQMKEGAKYTRPEESLDREYRRFMERL